MDSHQSLILDVAELGKDGVETLAAQLRNHYTTDYRAISEELEFNDELSDFEQQQMRDRLRQIEAEFESHMAVLDEIRTAYDSLPDAHAEITTELGDSDGDMSTAIVLAKNSIRLRQIYNDLQTAAADRLFA